MNRRQFLIAGSAALAIPAYVKAESLMQIWVPKKRILTSDEIVREALRILHHHMEIPLPRIRTSEIDFYEGVQWNLSATDEFNRRYLEPAMHTLGKKKGVV